MGRLEIKHVAADTLLYALLGGVSSVCTRRDQNKGGFACRASVVFQMYKTAVLVKLSILASTRAIKELPADESIYVFSWWGSYLPFWIRRA